jgi:hypothetical protein
MTGGGVTDAERLAEVRQLAALREKYPEWKIFPIAGGFGAVRDHLESALTANTVDDLATRLAEF